MCRQCRRFVAAGRLTDNFASFDADPRRSGRRKARWAINPLRDGARASAEAARFSSLEAELMQGLGRRKPD
jgi:hypothetical protein